MFIIVRHCSFKNTPEQQMDAAPEEDHYTNHKTHTSSVDVSRLTERNKRQPSVFILERRPVCVSPCVCVCLWSISAFIFGTVSVSCFYFGPLDDRNRVRAALRIKTMQLYHRPSRHGQIEEFISSTFITQISSCSHKGVYLICTALGHVTTLEPESPTGFYINKSNQISLGIPDHVRRRTASPGFSLSVWDTLVFKS